MFKLDSNKNEGFFLEDFNLYFQTSNNQSVKLHVVPVPEEAKGI